MKKLFSATADNIQFLPANTTKFKLKSNHNAQISQNEDAETLVRLSKSQTTILKATRVIPYNQLIVLTQSAFEPYVGIGLTADGSENPKLQLKTKENILMLGNQIYHNNKRLVVLEHKLKKHDRVGCGYIPHKQTVFFTYNGEKCNQTVYTESIDPYYPVIVLKYQNQCCRWVSNQSKFMFKFNEQVIELQNQIKNKFQKASQSIPKQHKYNMVYHYLEASGFTKTASLYKKELDPQFNLTHSEFKKNPIITPVIDLKPLAIEFQFPSFSSSSSSASSSSQSQKLHFGDSPPSHESYESSSEEQEWYSFDIFMKKGHYLSEEERPKKVRHPQEVKRLKKQRKERRKKQKKHKIEKAREQMLKKKEQQEKLKEDFNEIFVKEHLPIIINDINKGNFKQVKSMIELKIPELIKMQSYLQAYISAHIFFKIIKTDGPLAAIEYAKQQKSLKDNENILFPFYMDEKNTVQHRPLKEIVLRLDGKFNHQRQYEVFGMFLKVLILRKMGYYSANQLQLCFQHYESIKEWMKKLEVPQNGVMITD